MTLSHNLEFNIILHNNGEESKCKVRSLDSIFSLFNKLNDSPSPSISKLIYKNFILCQAFSFAFYGINEGSHIYAITKPQKDPNEIDNHKDQPKNNSILYNFNREKFRGAFEKKYGKNYNEEEFENSYHCFKDPSISLEVSKLKDQFYHKIEGTIKCHRKFVNNFFQNREKLFDINEDNNQNFVNNVNNEGNVPRIKKQ